MKHKKTLRIKITAWLVLFATIVALFPVSQKPAKAEAKVTDFKIVKVAGTMNDYTIGYNQNGDLIITGYYYSNPNALISYHTKYLYFHTDYSYGEPRSDKAGKKFRAIDVFEHETKPSTSRPGYVEDTYYVDHNTLREMVEILFGTEEEELTGQKQVYLSEGFQVKERKTTGSSNWTYRGLYNTLKDIVEAEGWSSTTEHNFKNYFDYLLTIDLDDIKPIKKKYKLEVEEEGNGIVSGSIGEFYAGESVYEIASPDNGWYLKEWKGNKVGIEGVDWDEETIRFNMPARDVKLIAVFEEVGGSKPPVTPKPPKITLAPESDGGGKDPTPTNTPTPAPTNQPVVDLKRDVAYHRYYTTDKGHSIDALADSPILYNRYGSSAAGSLFREKVSYQVGTDTEGNEWYFYANGNAATYVHPKKYKGYDVRSASIKYIEELTFPEKLVSGSTTYTVISIGGGLSWYGQTTVKPPAGSYSSWGQDMMSGSYSYYLGKSSESVVAYDYENLSYHFGVLGNGVMNSSSGVYSNYLLSGSEQYQKYDSSYTVYNTTLKVITIPKSVTRIEKYAFANCNALVKIEGGDGLRIIGENAFEGGSVGLMLSKGDGSNGSKNYITYNDSYALTLPYTDVMLEYDRTRQLSEYLPLAEFPRLQTIEKEAFLNRCNLFDVVLPASLVTVKPDAFKGAKLNTIELKNTATTIEGDRHTLGSKGYTTENVKTQIITQPDSTAMFYGLKNVYYYKVRCGYEITYDNNFTPEETYTTTAELAEEYIDEVKSVYAIGLGREHHLPTDFATIALDPDGNAWFRHPDNLLPELLDFGYKVKDIESVDCTQYITYHWNGGSTTYVVPSAYVYLESGEVYRVDEVVKDTTDTQNPYTCTWINIGVPKGATNHQWTYYEYITYGVPGPYGSTTNSYNYHPTLYYLTPDKQLECIGGSVYNKQEKIRITMPSGVRFETISVPTEQNGGSAKYSAYQNPNIYDKNTFHPYVFAVDTNGVFWTGETEPNSTDISSYKWTKGFPLGDGTINLRQVWNSKAPFYLSGGGHEQAGARSQEVFSYYGISEEGDLILLKHTYTTTHENGKNTNKHVASVLCEGNFVARYRIHGYSFLVDEDGYLWFFADKQDTLPVKLFSDANIVNIYATEEANTMYSTGSTSSRPNEYIIHLVTDQNQIWQIKYDVYWNYEGLGSGVRESYRATQPTVALLATFSSNIVKIQYHTVYGGTSTGWSGNDPEPSMLVLLENGQMYAYGLTSTNVYTDYAGKQSGYFSITGGKTGLVSPDGTVYVDIAHMQRYSLALDVEGNVWRSGYRGDYIGSENPYYDPARYAEFTLVPDMEMEYTPSGFFFSGYHFVERLYDNMFLRDGYTFLNWNLKEDNSDSPLYPDEELVVEGPTRIYANWEKTVNKVRYHPNGASGHMPDSVCDPLVTRKVVLSECLFVKDGHGFIGWNTKKDGTGTMYQPGTEYNTGTRTSTTLYAQWAPLDYTLHVAGNEVRVRPVTSTSHELSYNEEFTIPAAKPDRSFTVDYRLNKRSTMSTTPAWKTPTPFSDNYTKAKLKFIGWELWEEIAKNTEYNYLNRLYLPGQIDKNFARHKQYDPFLFPYWGGEDAYVDLPVAVCDGYWFVGYTTTATETDEENVIHAEDGSGAMYKPKSNETLYTYYEPKQYEIDLVVDVEDAEPGEIIETQTEVLMTFDKVLPTVEIPQSDIYIFMGYYDKLDADGHPITEGSGKSTQYYDEYGNPCLDASGNPLVWRIHDESVTKLYAYFISEIEVTLDGRGATKQEQKSVIMTYDQVGPDVIPPEKTGYTFQGYYTGIRGAGKRYFDENGKGCAVWLEKRTNILYAYWIQNPVELPEKDPTENPDVLPEDRVVIEASLDTSTVQIYADDNDPATGAMTDVQPYLVSDVVIDGKVVAEGAIPSTENVAIRAKMGAWLLSSVLERRSGVDYVRVYVTVPYQTQYEDEETEELIISDILYATYSFMIPKAWSYWVVADGGIYFPEKIVIENEALGEGREELSVLWNVEGAAEKPTYRIAYYGEKSEHVIWNSNSESNKGVDTDGVPCVSVRLSNVETIVSMIPGELPDVSLHLQNVCQNAAWRENSQFAVRSDGLMVEGVKLLEDAIFETGIGAMPNLYELENLIDGIEETIYQQTYKSGVCLRKEAKNDSYETKASIEYIASEENVGECKRKSVSVTEANEIKIHTPVLCDPIITADNDTMYQCESIPAGSTVLVLDEEGRYSDFCLRVENIGYHSEKKGYGERDYGAYSAKRNGEVQNEVCFPFPVWLDMKNDGEKENDIRIPEGEWYLLGDREQRFYAPIDTKEGLYELSFRSVAVNGAGREENTEEYCNSETTAYVATGSVSVFLTGRLYDFTVYRVQGTTAWNEVEESDMTYTVGIQAESGNVQKTLPLRRGGHPKYRNLGGLPMGGEISFRMKSIGSSFGKGSTVTIVPYLALRTGDEVEAVDVYYEEETERGVFLRKWEEEEQKRRIKVTEDVEGAIREWQDVFRLPDCLYIAKKGTDVFEIQRKEGLSFNESFWVKEEPLILCFAITLENPQGEKLYYGRIPRKIKNNIWKTEAKDSYREDSSGNCFEILGGEVAIIYFGDSADEESAIYGIY